jgi:hypothetical protein
MAGQARRGERGQRRSSRADSSWPAIAAASGVASGSATATTTPASPGSSRELPTRATYRNLLLRGLAPDEAANLTAFMAGITVGESHWTLRQINQLLFLREMNRTGQFSEPTDPRPH